MFKALENKWFASKYIELVLMGLEYPCWGGGGRGTS